MMKTWAERHRAFMEAGGQTTAGFNEAQFERYVDHIGEEYDELIEAIGHGDYVKALDGLQDLMVVAMGATYSLGVDPDDSMLAVLEANLRKVVDGKVFKREDGQIGKPEGWYGPEPELRELLRVGTAGALA